MGGRYEKDRILGKQQTLSMVMIYSVDSCRMEYGYEEPAERLVYTNTHNSDSMYVNPMLQPLHNQTPGIFWFELKI
jgi:hypothetical protein